VWRQVIYRVVLVGVVPLNRGVGLSVRAPNRIGHTRIWLACTRGYERASLMVFPPSRVRIVSDNMIPILGQGWRYVLSIGWGRWGFPSNRGLCSNLDLSCKRGLGLASLVKLSTNRNMVIRCERWDGATRVGASDRGWERPSVRGSRKCQNKTRNEMVPRRSGNSRSSEWNLCRSKNKNIQRMISRGKCWGESRRKRHANGSLASHHIPDVISHSIWDHCVMGRL
jgi:hypothetical protein